MTLLILLAFIFFYSLVAHFVFRWQENDHEIVKPPDEDFPSPASMEHLIAVFWPITVTGYIIFFLPRRLVLKLDNMAAARREKKKLNLNTSLYR